LKSRDEAFLFIDLLGLHNPKVDYRNLSLPAPSLGLSYFISGVAEFHCVLGDLFF